MRDYARAGAKAALAYMAVVIPLYMVVAMLTSYGNGRLVDGVLGAVLLPVCMYPFGIVLGVLPAAILGGVDGLLVGSAMAIARYSLTPRRAALLGALVGCGLAALVHGIAFGDGVSSLPVESYLFWLGGPTVIGIVVSTTTGTRVFRRYLERPS